MKRASWALSLSASALGAVLAAGCGSSSTTNEEVVGTTGSPTAAPTGAAPTYKNYAEFAKAQNEQTAKGAGKGKDASKGQAAGKGH
jgi:hypothetical protein